MKNLRIVFRGLIAWLALTAVQCLNAAPPAPGFSSKEIPDALKPWGTWATWSEEHRF
jgi:hypothetical protein